MTAKQMIKALQAIVAEHGNVKVAVDWKQFDCSNGVYDIVDTKAVTYQVIPLVDGDGFHIENKDGTERMQRTAVIS